MNPFFTTLETKVRYEQVFVDELLKLIRIVS